MQNFPRRIINKTFGNLNIRVYRGKFGYVLDIISEQSVNSFPFLALRSFSIRFLKFLNRKKFDFLTIQFVTISQITILFARFYRTQKTSVLRISFFSLSLFFRKKTKGQHFNDSVAKKEEKEGRGGPLIVFIFTWREIVHQRWHRYQHTSRVFPLGLNERR